MAILDIIKYEGDNNTLAWKHPKEDFNTLSTLIVNESQEAIFFSGGQAQDVFGPGKHTLETKNIPLLRKIINIHTGGQSPFHCQIYFVNKTVQMALKWGTDSKIRFIEPSFGIPVEIGACGEMNLTVCDSKKLVSKLVGTMKGIAWGETGTGFTKSIQSSFRPMISTMVKSELASGIKESGIDILEIDQHLTQLSEKLRQKIAKGFEEYGLTVPEFYVTNITLPENDANFRRMRELHSVNIQTRMVQAEALVKSAQADADADVAVARRRAELERQTTETEITRRELERDLLRAQAEAQATKMTGMADIELKRMEGMAEAEIMAAKGYSQKDVLTADVQKAYAESMGSILASGGGGSGVSSGIVGEFVSLGVGLAAADQMRVQMGEMVKGFTSSSQSAAAAIEPKAEKTVCQKCGAELAGGAKFCLECGEKVAPKLPEGMISCPECGSTVSKAKFCAECGYKLVTECPNCNAEIKPGAKFCAECGTRL